MPSERRCYVLDTNVLLLDPNAIFGFEEHDVIIPLVVLEEIDRFKSELSETGRNAREVSRLLDTLREEGSLREGVTLRSGGVLRVVFTTGETVFGQGTADNQILTAAQVLGNQDTWGRVVLVTRDTNMRLKADSLGIRAEDYRNMRCVSDNTHQRVREAHVDKDVIDSLYATGSSDYYLDKEVPDLYVNECLILKCGQQSAMARWMGDRLDVVRQMKDPIWGITPRNKEQAFALDLLLDEDIRLVTLNGVAGTGKAQPLDAKVLTPTGWTTMGEIQPGDRVISGDGTPTLVQAVFPQGEKDIYKVVFSDGTSTECCEEHLWMTRTQRDRDYRREGSVKPLSEIKNTLRVGTNKRNHAVPMVKPVSFERASEAPVDPYLLGCLLGDGGMSVGQPTLTSADDFILESCANALAQMGCALSPASKYRYYVTAPNNTAGPPPQRIRQTNSKGEIVAVYESIHAVGEAGVSTSAVYKCCGGARQRHLNCRWEYEEAGISSKNPLRAALDALGLWGKKSHEKHVPHSYLFAPVEERLALLQGLMDTDGTVSKDGTYTSYTSTSEQLAQDVVFLVQSLGGKATCQSRQTSYTYKNIKKTGRVSYRVSMSMPPEIIPFRLPRKRERYTPRTKYLPTRYIDRVEYVGTKKAQCILVEHPEHLYVTDNFIVTHNTLLALAAALHQTTDLGVYRKVLVSRPIFPMGRDIGFLPGDIGEKLNPWMKPIFDNLEYLISGKDSDKKKPREKQAAVYAPLIEQGYIEVEPLTYIRGRSIPDQFLIIDEAQNLTPHEVKTILTRAGEGTKVVLTGDPDQIDNPYVDQQSNGLSYVTERFKSSPLAGHVTLVKGERSELAEIAAKLL